MLDKPEFRAAWFAWVDSRPKTGKIKFSEQAARLQLKNLAKTGSISAAIEIIEFSAMNSYQGLIFDRIKPGRPPPETRRHTPNDFAKPPTVQTDIPFGGAV